MSKPQIGFIISSALTFLGMLLRLNARALAWRAFTRQSFRYCIPLFIALLLGGCSRSPRLEAHKTGVVSSPQTFGLRNLTTLRVDPNGNSVKIDWRGYNIKSGNALRVPYEQIQLLSASETYVITTRGARNDELIVNSKPFQFDSEHKHLLIRFGSGVTIENGGDYQRALKVYEVNFEKSK